MEDFRRTSACGVFNDPKLFPIPSNEAMRIVSDIRRIDAYGDSSVIACLTYSEAAQLIEHYAAAQRQAGREEAPPSSPESMESYVQLRLADLQACYAALEEAARFLVSGYCGPCRYGDIDSDIHDLRKALRDLDEGRRG